MKQNNTNMLFKSVALCFLILGNLTFEVLCAPTATVEVKSGEVDVPKIDVCDAINKHYKVKSSEDFFQSLVAAVTSGATDYMFQFNSTKTGKEILTEKIAAAKTKTPALKAADAFNAFKTEVAKITTDSGSLKTPVTVTAVDLEKFMSNFEFKGGKFELKGAGSGVTLDDIADNLVVYLNVDLPAFVNEVKALNGVNDAQQANLIAAEEKLAAATTAAAAADATTKKAEADAKNELDKVKDEARKQTIAAAKTAVLGKLAPAPTAAPTSLKALLDALNKLYIKTEYEYVVPATTGATTAAATTGATAKVEYSIVDTAVTAAVTAGGGVPKISSTPIDIKAADIDIAKIFFPRSFIDTSKDLAKDVFVAISQGCTAGTDANESFGKVLTELSTNANAVTDALIKCVLDKTVSKDQFNEVFKSFAIDTAVDVKEGDIIAITDLVTVENDNCKVNLHYLSTDEKPFGSYIAWLESDKKLASTSVADKVAAVNAFFTLLKDQKNLDAYKTKLEENLKGSDNKNPKENTDEENKPEGGGGSDGNGKKPDEIGKKPKVPNKSTVQNKPKPETKSKTKTILIVVGSVLGASLIGVGIFIWKSYFKGDKV